MPRTRRLALAAAAATLTVLAAPATAGAINVTTTADGANPAGCSLREAVESANQNIAVGGCTTGLGPDVIDLPAGTYTLTNHGAGNNTPTTGDLDVTENLTIQGAGATKSIVDGDAADRVFEVLSPSVVELRDLTVRNGRTPDGAGGSAATTPPNADSVGGAGASAAGSGATQSDGGGIRNLGDLTLTRVRVTGNHAGAGGNGAPGGTASNGTAAPGFDSQGGNGGAGANGGGIADDLSGDLTIDDSVIAGNTAGAGGAAGSGGPGGTGAPGFGGGNSQGGAGGYGGSGGGVYVDFVSGPSLTVTRSAISGNGAGAGGAGGSGGAAGAGGNNPGATGGNGGSSSGGGSNFGGAGGGIDAEAGTSLQLTDTTISDNTAGAAGMGGNGGAGGAAGTGLNPGAGGTSVGGPGGNAGFAGGLQTFAASNTISKVAVVRNSAGRGGDGGTGASGASNGGTTGGNGSGGGLYGGVNLGGGTPAFSFANVTIGENHAGRGGDGGGAGTGPGGNVAGLGGQGGSAGGIEIQASAGQVQLSHLTIASNTVGTGGTGALNGANGAVGGLDHDGGSNPPALVNTIIANNGGAQCGGTNGDGGDNLSFPDDATCGAAFGDDPLLGPVAGNGGLTPTMRLLAGSPAIDHGGIGFPCTATDQRGVTRPKGSACDIGAVERSLPSATTGGANSVRARQASVAGTVNPGQLGTTYFFRFGRTAAYGARTAAAGAGAGAGNVVALATLRRLTPNATYHYRLVVANPDGTVTGADRTFRTARLPFPGVKILTSTTTVKDGVAKIGVACPGPQAVLTRCTGSLRLTKRVKRHGKKRTLNLGRAGLTIASGKSKILKVELSEAGRKLVETKGKLTATATARSVDARGGKPQVSTRKLTLKAP